MGKEAKIGLGVISILLIVFGVVLAQRLSGSGDAPEVTASDDPGEGAPQAQDDPQEDTKVTVPAAAPQKPTVVLANALSSKEPPAVPKKVRPWRSGPDEGKTPRNGHGGKATTLPPIPMIIFVRPIFSASDTN